jgi:N-acetylneuraminic acid mutarotase
MRNAIALFMLVGAAPLWADETAASFIERSPDPQARMGGTYSVLRDGRILAVGGFTQFFAVPTDACDLYDPRAGRWQRAAPLPKARAWHWAAVLPSGEVLVTGGTSDNTIDLQAEADTFLYDPRADRWTALPEAALPTPAMNTHGRMDAIVLDDGRVLVAGGWRLSWHLDPQTGQEIVDVNVILTDAFLFTPWTGRWTRTGSLHAPRATAAVLKLHDGRVLHVGGIENTSFTTSATGDVYDPRSGAWTPTPNLIDCPTDDDPSTGYSDNKNKDDNHGSRWQHAAALLPDGEVLIAGGAVFNGPSGGSVVRRSAIVYDPRGNAWREVAPMRDRRTGARAVRRTDGGILIVGSSLFASGDLQTTEVLAGGSWIPGPSLTDDPMVSIFDGGLVGLVGHAVQFAGIDLATFAASARVFSLDK